MTERVKPDSLITLNYRIASSDGIEFVGTFASTPATLQMGNGELAPALERCLEGMAVGERREFELPSEQAFGPRVPQLVQRIPRAQLPAHLKLEERGLLEYDAPNGARFTGLVCELDEESALIDFNHPLAGKPIRFEAEIIGVI